MMLTNPLLRMNDTDFPALAYWLCEEAPELAHTLIRDGLIYRSGNYAYWTDYALDKRRDLLAARRRGNKW